MKVRVALPISKPLRRGGFIADSYREHTWVKFKYERLPIFCHICGLLGHDLRPYASHFAAEKNGEDVDYQYGNWLKASDSRQRSPTQDVTPDPNQQSWMPMMPENLGVDIPQRDDNLDIHGKGSKSNKFVPRIKE